MVNGGVRRQDPLRIERGVTLFGVGTNTIICKFRGSGRDETVTVLGHFRQRFSDQNSASVAARKACEKGNSAFVAIAADGSVHLGMEITDTTELRQLTSSILAQRREQRGREFAGQHQRKGGYTG